MFYESEIAKENIRSGMLRNSRMFVDEIGNEDSVLGNAIKNVKGGISIAQNISEQYNKIAQWCGFSEASKPFFKK